ncbi:Protein C04F6.7 [Aphelenchoides avenae]|nr:Protein C04F6.7 [Aphelenchus avenae]
MNGLQLDQELADSGLAIGWLLDTLWKRCPEFRDALANGKVHEITSRDISEGKGYVSKVYKTTLKLTNATGASFTVMLKVPTNECLKKLVEETVTEGDKETHCMALFDVYGAHNVECQIYDMLSGANCLPIPNVWYARQAKDGDVGVIMMSDLTDDGVGLGWTTSLSLQQVKNIVRDFAVFHSYILGLDEDKTKEWRSIPAKTSFHIEEFLGFLGDMIAAVPEWKHEPYKSLLDQLKPTMAKEFGRYSLTDRPQELGLPLMLCLGDTGAHNMFFKKAPDGTASNEVSAYIDFQIAFAGNQFFDIVRILCAYCDAEVRREAELTLVDDYYATLVEHLQKDGRTVDFGLEQLREAYALARAHQTLFAVAVVGFVDAKKDEFAPSVLKAWREKLLLRAKLVLEDSTESLKTYAPQFIAQI